MSLERVNPPSLSAPSGFSHAVTAHGGTLVFLAGQTAQDDERRIIDGGIVVQFEKALSNLLVALDAAGGRPENLAKLTIFAVDPEDYRANAREIGAVWHRLAGRDYPAMALIGIVRLWDESALVELEGIAVLPD